MTSQPLLHAGGLCIDSPGGRALFRDLELRIDHEQVAVIGRNGVGKSSLLEVLAGHEEAQRGSVRCNGQRRLVRQQLGADLRSGGASPGELRRQALEQGRRERPDLLLLDEPTQDLDADSIEWLLGWLQDWDRGLIVVSHDRRVLRLFRHFFIVAESGCRYFSGDFDALMAELQAESNDAQQTYVRNLQQLLAKEKGNVALARRRQRKKDLGRIRELGRSTSTIALNGKRGDAQASQGKRSVLQNERIEASRQWAKATRRAMSVDLPLEVLLPAVPAPLGGGPPIVRLEGIAARVGERTLFEELDLELSSRDRVAITGPNGAGKSTLLQIMGREREPTLGRARTDLLRVGFVAQNASNWMSDESLLSQLSACSDATSTEQVAELLMAHRFPFALAERPLASLSPGERVRAALICLFQRRPVVELLVLDEPTDHLDFVGVAALEAALRAWAGGLCVVSHDEEFLQAIGVQRRIALGSEAAKTPPWRDDPDAIAHEMAEALRGRYEGWETVTAGEIAVADHSGLGGGKAYKLTNLANPAAPAAALHILEDLVCRDPEETFIYERQRIAHQIFSDAGLTARRIREDPDKVWFVEEWAGATIQGEDLSIELVEEIARLIARAHAVDTAWYDILRRQQCERYPALENAPKGSHIWWFASKPHAFLDPVSPRLQRMWIEAGPAPVTAAGSRLVTAHGDVTPNNIVRTADGLKFIDMEYSCVNYAIHDLAFFVGVMDFGFDSLTDQLQQAFIRAYLVECGSPASAADVFALRLDVERCRMATNFFDPNSLWDLVNMRVDCDDLGTAYAELVAIADRALLDPELAHEILRDGFDRHPTVRAIQAEVGRPVIGMCVTVHADAPEPVMRSGLQINWDGTIQSTWELWRGAVLGVDAEGRVVLTNCGNPKERLRLCMDGGRIPITGRRAPASAPIPLRLAGSHADQALVLSEVADRHMGNDVQFVKVGRREDALLVHVEPDGVIRLADRPDQAFDCASGKTSPGTRVNIYHNHCHDNQKFVLNDDSSLSPVENHDVVWGLLGDQLTLVPKDDPRAERLEFGEELARASQVRGPGTMVEGEPAAWDGGVVLELWSHPGRALSVDPCAYGDDATHLVLVPIASAERVIVARDHLRLANGGGRIALGVAKR
ncbi:MAG: ATP-binding cassette domain-containing protein [bacterium]|nr:ATP-binding cassette domain-containing protein [bacterium]